jgi:hypothetical protein
MCTKSAGSAAARYLPSAKNAQNNHFGHECNLAVNIGHNKLILIK